MDIFLEPRVKNELLAESSFYNFVQSWETGGHSLPETFNTQQHLFFEVYCKLELLPQH